MTFSKLIKHFLKHNKIAKKSKLVSDVKIKNSAIIIKHKKTHFPFRGFFECYGSKCHTVQLI